MYPENHLQEDAPEKAASNRESIFTPEELEELVTAAETEMAQFRPLMQDFINENIEGFKEMDVHEDMYKINIREAEWSENSEEEKEANKIATLAEHAFFKYFRIWSKGKIQTVMPSRFDDVTRGIDMVLEFPESEKQEGKYSALAIDVVLGTGDKFITKLMGIKNKVIDKGRKENGLKYFKPDGKNLFKGFMAPGVVSMNPPALKKLFDQEKNGEMKSVEKSLIPYLVTGQLLEQYKGFEEYATSVGQPEIAESYRKARQELENATESMSAELAFNPKLKEVVDSSIAVKKTKIFFKLLKEGDYLQDAEKIIKERELLEKESENNNENYEAAA